MSTFSIVTTGHATKGTTGHATKKLDIWASRKFARGQRDRLPKGQRDILPKNGTFGRPEAVLGDNGTCYLKTGHLGVPKVCLGTTRQATKKRVSPAQNGTYGHIRYTAIANTIAWWMLLKDFHRLKMKP
ncbi:hypothetical protein AVEN_120485-1 [Araneus ventricosus]|uniref:Uncharacterized protein n=1 Tax=Araneus ventricosus TaxID=182803 RepID=A0A4Y2MKD1_ARAVE|nr:hypothetical protein AVEN_120485-1 [Araneus ventricosus]